MGFFDKPEVIGPGGDGGVDRARLADLEQRVARLEAQVAQLIQSGQADPATYAAPAPPSWMAEVQALRSRGKTIQAIKVYRDHTGVGLKEARDAVEGLPR